LVGRSANRIASGRFSIDGHSYQLDVNDGTHSLHGGRIGFGRRLWNIEVLPRDQAGNVAIALSLNSAHGDQGYPGNLRVRVCYTLTPDNCWKIDYEAETDRPTLVNLSSHSYFNLAGEGSALDHELMINADRYAPVDLGLIPTGRADVVNTVFDFRRPKALRDCLSLGYGSEAQFALTRGFDHHFDINRNQPSGLCTVARLSDAASGRTMEVLSTENGVQFYTGNFLDGSLIGTEGNPLRAGDGLCLETQEAPNAINDLTQEARIRNTVLRPGELYSSSTVHCFTNEMSKLTTTPNIHFS